MFNILDGGTKEVKITSKIWQRIGLVLTLLWVSILVYFLYETSERIRVQDTLFQFHWLSHYLKYFPVLNAIITLCMYLSIRLKEPNTIAKYIVSFITFSLSLLYIYTAFSRMIIG